MKNLKFNFKSIVQTKARWLLTFCALLTLGVGQVWGEDDTRTVFLDISQCDWYLNNGYEPRIWVSKNDAKSETYETSYSEIVSTNIYRFEIAKEARCIQFLRYNNGDKQNWSGDIWINNDDSGSSAYKYHNYFKLDNNAATVAASNQTCFKSTGEYLYFYADNLTTKTNVALVLGRWNYSAVTAMSKLTNTENLYYCTGAYFNDSYSYFSIVGTTSAWGSGSWGVGNISSAADHTAVKYGYQFNSGSTYYATKSSTSKGAAVSIEHKSTGYSGIPTITTTLNIKVREATGGDYSDGNVADKPAATIKINGTYLSNNGTTSTSASTWSSGSSCTYNTVISGKVTPEYETLDDNWQFDGWYIGSTSQGTGTSFWFYQTSATTVEARFTRTKYDITLNNHGATTTGTTSVQATYNSNTNLTSNIIVPTKKGYTFQGYYTGTNGSGSQLITAAGAWNASVTNYTDASKNWIKTSNVELHAYWIENKTSFSAVTADAEKGSVTGTTSGSIGVSTTASVTANPVGGYYFTGWSQSGGNHVALSGHETDNPLTVRSDGTDGGTATTLTANFAKRFALRGSRYNDDNVNTEGMPGWTNTTADMTITDGVSRKTVTLEPNREYRFLIYDLMYSAARGYVNENQKLDENTLSGSLDGIYSIKMNTAGLGDYTFAVSVSSPSGGITYPRVQITNPASWQITMGTTTWTEGVGSDGNGAIGTGGTNTAEDGDDYTIVNSNYVKNNGSVTFTAAPNSGYQFMGWYNADDFDYEEDEPVSTHNPYTVENITSAQTVYALFKEIVYDVTVVNSTGSGSEKVGSVSHPTITAVVPSGKVFDRWITTGSARVNSPYSSTTTITAASDNQSTVTATFKELPYIYYYIKKAHANGGGGGSWNPSTMYVYFYMSSYWDDTYGAGYKNCTNYCYAMEKVDEDGFLWRYRYDPKDFAGTITNIAFLEQDQHTYDHFEFNTGSYCEYHSCMNMFVLTSHEGNAKNGPGHTTYYYNDDWAGGKGYWRNYEEVNSGFYLNNLTSGSYSEEFTDEDGDGIFTVVANLSANTSYKFYIGGCGGGNWSNKDDYITGATNKTDATMFYYSDVSDSYRCQITTTVGGYYTFKLAPSLTSRQLELEVEYPVTANDYRAVYNNAVSLPTIKRPSNIIESGESSGTISLWLNEGTNYISFQKASLDVSGNVSWVADGAQQTVTGIAKAGVYTMTLNKSGSPRIPTTSIQPYTGEYYIRTDCAPGGWEDYKENKLIENTLTFNDEDENTFDYYYCKWVGNSGTNVRFVVANDYNMAISDTLTRDDIIDPDEENVETLPQAASVRFAYNSYRNVLSRAYLSGSTNISDRFLVMKGDSKLFNSSGQALTTEGGGKVSGLNDYELNFDDKNNWVYQVDVQAKSGAQVYLVASYNGSDRDLYGSSSDKKTLITSSNEETLYHLTTIYDFKTNNLMTAWKPGASAITENISGVRSVMLVRSHHGNADQITIGAKGSISSTTVYGVMQFSKYTLNNQSTASGHATLDPLLSEAERGLYWISFPFDVRLKEVFGFGTYYRHWAIEYYDGAARAREGYWTDSDGFWKLVTPAEVENGGDDNQGFVLKKNVGYVLALDLDLFTTSSSIWNNSVTDVALYFPSENAETITNTLPTSVEVPEHYCTIDRRTDKSSADINKDRRIADSHWNVIGVPSYQNVAKLDSVGKIKTIDNEGNYVSVDYPSGIGFYYKWIPSTNRYDVTAKSDTTKFKTMHAYMLQFAGIINWESKAASLAAVAARTTNRSDLELNLELHQGDAKVDQTYIRFSDNENVTANFEFNYDLMKIMNANMPNIYTMIEDYLPAGGNYMPYSTQTTIVPVGVKVVANGDYTFSIPDGTSGMNVTLVDTYTGARTSLGLIDYTTYLTTGTHDGRFLLEIAPVQNVVTEIENAANANANANADVRKVLIDGRLYIVKDGKAYDAQGHRVN